VEDIYRYSFVASNSETGVRAQYFKLIASPIEMLTRSSVFLDTSSSHVGLWLGFGPEQEEQNCAPMKPR